MDDYFSKLIGDIAFPILVASFLLVRVEKRLDQLNTTIINLVEHMVKQRN